MKQKIALSLLLMAIFAIFTTCEKPERNNPWDDKANIDPASWAPQNLQIEDVSITEKKLTWTYTDHNIEGFKLDRKKGNEAWQVAYQTFPKETRNWNDTEIVPDATTTYSYRVYAFAGSHNSAEQNASASADFAPTDLQTEKLTDKSYKLTWTDNSTGEQGFKIDRKIDENNWAIDYGTVAQNQTTFTDTNVFRAANVEYRVYAFYESYGSSKATTNTSAELTAPINPQLEKINDKSYRLQWTDNSDSEEGFKIDRRLDNGNWVKAFGEVPANQQSFIDTNVFRAKNIEYSVYAFSGNAESTSVIANTNAELTPPYELQIINHSITALTLNWQDNSTGEDGFKIERKFEGGDWQVLTTVTNNTCDDNDFELNTQVYYRVCAYVGNYNSSWAESDFDATIPPPENLEITASTITSVTLNWNYNYTGHDGFKIDRKVNDGAWEEEFAVLDAGLNSFTDNSVNLGENEYTYRIYSFVNTYESGSVEQSILLELGMIIEGGIIFYLDGNGGGLVCAESDQSTNAEWGCYGTTIGGTGTGIGTGAANTAAIVAGCSETGIAARICDELVLNGYSDWFLSSQDELNLMYQNLKLNCIGGFADDYYWSSSENSSNYAWGQYFSSGSQLTNGKDGTSCVRAVRAF